MAKKTTARKSKRVWHGWIRLYLNEPIIYVNGDIRVFKTKKNAREWNTDKDLKSIIRVRITEESK